MQTNISQIDSYLGIDVAKEKIHICLLLENKKFNKVYSNDEEGFKKLISFLNNKKTKSSICIEATGKFYIKIATFLHKKGYRVSTVNPYKIISFKNANLVRNKTDLYYAML